MKMLIKRTFMILIYLKLCKCDLLKLYSYDGNIIRHSKLKHIFFNSNNNYFRRTKDGSIKSIENVTEDLNFEPLQMAEVYETKTTVRVERSSTNWRGATAEVPESSSEPQPGISKFQSTEDRGGGGSGKVNAFQGDSTVRTEIRAESQTRGNSTFVGSGLKSEALNAHYFHNRSAGENVTLGSDDLEEVRQRHPKDDAEIIESPELGEDVCDQQDKECKVSYLLKKVETQHTLGGNCTPGTELNLGDDVVDRYAQERFRVEADVAVNRANMLTRLWKYAESQVMESEYLLHAGVISMVEFDDDIFAAGNCYDENQYKSYKLFCPYAYRLPEGPILAKDLAVEYKYLSNTSEWFYIARKNAENVIRKNSQFHRGYNTYTHKINASVTTHTTREEDEILVVTYEDGKWSKPYYDCGGGNIWMLTYTVPFFGFANNSYFFKGTSGIDIDLRRVDIDQCPQPSNSTQINIFSASDKCKKRTTECVSVPGLGFRRGSYKCVCKRSYYFPDTEAVDPYFNGSVIEEEYEKLMMNSSNDYNKTGIFECLPCAEGCESCRDGRPCVVSLNWMLRTTILVLSFICVCCLPAVVLFTWKYRNVKVIRAASPVLLRVIAVGALFIYATTIVMYPVPNIVTCSVRVWLREIGFMLTYGALMLKTWRISVIFRVRSAKMVKITDVDLLKRLGMMLGAFGILLLIRTLVAPPTVIVGRTAEDLKAYLCSTDWWDHSFSILEAFFLIWGIRLCIVVRKAPSEFNESRFISMAIYNEFLLSVFLNVSMLFLQSPANPDLLYIIFFCHTQLTVTLLLCLIFGSKAYMLMKGHGKTEETLNVATRSQASRFAAKPRSLNNFQAQVPNDSNTAYSPEYSNISDYDMKKEFRRLYNQLSKLREENMRKGNKQLAARISAMQEASKQGYAEEDIMEEDSSDCIVATELFISNKVESVAVAVQVNGEDIQPPPEEPPSSASPAVIRSSEEVSCSSDPSTSVTIRSKVKTKTKCSRKMLHKKLGNNKSLDNCKKPPSPRSAEDSPPSTSKSSNLKSGHAKTHAIVINLDDKNRFTEEVTV